MPFRRRLAWVIALLLPFAVLIPSCTTKPEDPWGGTKKKKVLVTIVPLYCFTAHIAGDHCEVRCLCITKGPHHFQPSIQEAQLLHQADLVIANGLGLEGFLDPMVRGSGRKDLTVVRVGDAIAKPADAAGSQPGQLIEVPGYRHGDHYHPPGFDPHVWLGAEEAMIQVGAILDALCRLDAAHAADYRARAEEYLVQLRSLREQGKKLAQTEGGLATAHDSWRYFARSFFGPKYMDRLIAIQGLQGEEISAQELPKLVLDCRNKNVRVIATEPQYPRSTAESLQRSLTPPPRIIPLDTLETAELLGGTAYKLDRDWYVKKMTENLERLEKALQGP
jgi:ABC-type Zn uptake system ZnuABC Zn-binding protein ZnuA